MIKKIAVCSVLMVLVSVLAAKKISLGYYRIRENGMYPGLPAGSLLVTNKKAYPDESSVKRGDVVVFEREEKGKRCVQIRRVVALPGDKVETSGLVLAVNGRRLPRQRVREENGNAIFREEIDTTSYDIAFDASSETRPPDLSLLVPMHQFFVMGDNRFHAADSRFLGPIPFHSIVGKKL